VVGQLKARGMSVTEMPAAELDKIRAAVQPVIDKNSEAIGTDFVQAFYGELRKFRSRK
jgi:TRAP-type C4-dicarboxylate transport system substrate-binding protein